VGFVVDKVASGQVFFEYFGFPCIHSTKFSILTITRGRYNRPVSGRRFECTQFGLHPPTMQIKKKCVSVRLTEFLCVPLFQLLNQLIDFIEILMNLM
jgi:hypothetical protein